MKSKTIPSIIAAATLLTNVNAIEIDVTKGWGLYGTQNGVNDINNTFDNSNINTIWAYDANGWKAYSPDTTMNNTLKNVGITNLDQLNTNVGFWINAFNATSVTLPTEETDSTNEVLLTKEVRTRKNADGSLNRTETLEYQYDNEDRLVSKMSVRKNSDDIKVRDVFVIYTYNNVGCNISFNRTYVNYNTDGTIASTKSENRVHTCDENNLQITGYRPQSFVNANGEGSLSYINYEYFYGDNNLTKKRRIYNADNSLKTYSENKSTFNTYDGEDKTLTFSEYDYTDETKQIKKETEDESYSRNADGVATSWIISEKGYVYGDDLIINGTQYNPVEDHFEKSCTTQTYIDSGDIKTANCTITDKYVDENSLSFPDDVVNDTIPYITTNYTEEIIYFYNNEE
jgi:hypothetical protein